MPAPVDCQLCPLHQYRTHVVNGEIRGTGKVELLVVGEGPGGMEDTHARPFVGPTGAFLEQELRANGITTFALTNATRCYPGEAKKEAELRQGIEACHPFLQGDIEALQPKVILALGAWAARSLGYDDPFNTIQCHVLEFDDTPVVVSYHPAVYFRDAGSLHLFDIALGKVKRLLAGEEVGEKWEPQYLTTEEFKRGLQRP